ncbi:MAG: hypothetical protein MH252_06300 [Thermosynechococcaceae cyanobacterium MS004]|nr:hypothetical protein [Thermosynechococcaceae cyanobacterium MS004]
MSYSSSKKYIRRIAAITCLFFCLGLVAISLVHVLIPYLLKFWENNYQVETATIKYRVISLIIGTVVSVVFYITARTILPRSKIKKLAFATITIVMFFVLCLAILSSVQRSTLNCERSRNICELERAGLWWSKTQQFSLKTLRGAYIQVDGTGDNITRRVALLTFQGEIPMTYTSYSPGLQHETSSKINFFVKHLEQESLQVYEDDRWMSVLFFIVIGILFSIIVLLFGARIADI